MMHIRSQKVPVKYVSQTYVAEDASVRSSLENVQENYLSQAQGFTDVEEQHRSKLPFVLDVIASKPGRTKRLSWLTQYI